LNIWNLFCESLIKLRHIEDMVMLTYQYISHKDDKRERDFGSHLYSQIIYSFHIQFI